MSDSVRPHRRQSTRLPCPWDSPGKNTGVGCHFLLQCMKVKMKAKSLSCVQLLATPSTAAWQASLSITNSWSLLKLMSIESVMPSNHLILCRPLLLLSSIFPSIRVFSNESVLCNKWPEYWSFSFSISPSNEYSRLISSNLWPPPYMKYNQMKIVIGVNRTCILKWHVDIKKTF